MASRAAAPQSDALVLVGTTKGAFLLRSSSSRRSWTVTGPHFRGRAVHAMLYHNGGSRRRLWAAVEDMHFGALLKWSEDGGKSWTDAEPIRFPKDSGLSMKRIWQLAAGQGDTLYCGAEPAALFESKDAGAHWSPVPGFLNHPHRPRWEPGGGGLCLHTILPDPGDPKRMVVAMSTGGVYRTEDGGVTWRARNVGVRAQYLPDKYPEFGQCVHKVVQHPSQPERLFLQNHWGLYRSNDGADSWQDIANGVPSDFGFAMAIHPRDAGTVFIVPIESDEFRCVPERKLRVYRTRNGGESWQAQTRGLPQKGAYETILRDGLSTDSLEPAGVYFGTRSGKVYGSNDEGTSWKLLVEGLPPVLCVKTAAIPAAKKRAKARRPSPARARKSPSRK